MLKRNLFLRASVYSRSGYGEHSRDILKALWDSGLFNIGIHPTRWGESSLTANIDEQMLEIIKFCMQNTIERNNAIFMHVGLPSEFEKLGKYNIGVTAGLESESIPKDWVDKCNEMDLVIVPSTFGEQLFRRSGVSSDILVCPEGVNIDIFNNKKEPFEIPDITTNFNFLTLGQWLPYELYKDRKQIAFLIKQFIEAFRYTKDVGLIIKTYTLNTETPDAYFTLKRFEDLLKMCGLDGAPPIYFIHGDLTDDELSGLYNHPTVKGFVTLTSGEGWGRSLAEAVSCGVPVIAPDWSSYKDFILNEFSILMPIKMAKIPIDVIQSYRGIFPDDARWAAVSPDTVITTLKKFHMNYELYKKKADDYIPIFQEKFSFKSAYAKLTQKLIDITPAAVEKTPGLKVVKT